MNSEKSLPIIDRSACDGESSCLKACPHGVLGLEKIKESDLQNLTTLARFKVWVNGSKQAYVINPDACENCRACEQSCRRGAISFLQ